MNWTEEDQEELSKLLARGKWYPDSNLFMPADDDATRYYELIDRKCEFLWEQHKQEQRG